jgi:hypothetical protein
MAQRGSAAKVAVSGTDGGDYNYRQTVDNRYQIAAKARSSLLKLRAVLRIYFTMTLIAGLIAILLQLHSIPFDPFTVMIIQSVIWIISEIALFKQEDAKFHYLCFLSASLNFIIGFALNANNLINKPIEQKLKEVKFFLTFYTIMQLFGTFMLVLVGINGLKLIGTQKQSIKQKKKQ